jgi:hypothetical protein
MADGGKGGNARVSGKGRAIGGPGGDGGVGEGKPGDGPDALVKGDGVALGGAGGHCGTADGRGGRRTISPGETMGLPTEMWRYGHGGRGGNHPEYDRRLALLKQIRREYCEAFPSDVPFIEAGVEPVPTSWVNARLRELGESWQVTMGEGGYRLPPLSA